MQHGDRVLIKSIDRAGTLGHFHSDCGCWLVRIDGERVQGHWPDGTLEMTNAALFEPCDIVLEA
jgi:hypothetical protein